jgi:hypothetical protein
MSDLERVNLQWGRGVSRSTSVSPANSHSSDFFLLINHPVFDGGVNSAVK